MTEKAEPADVDFVDLQRILNGDKYFQQWRKQFIERRIKEARSSLIKPCGGIEDVLAAERHKGAAIALEGLLVVLDTKVPDKRKGSEDDVEDTEHLEPGSDV